MRADLHTHSVYSDGYYAPEELCRRAKANGVELLSITDHDTMNGDKEKRAAAERYGLLYVSGWEISAYAGESKIHVTGYNCKRGAAYRKFEKDRMELGFERAQDSIDKLKAAGIFISLGDAKARRADPSAPVHTMHIAQAAAAVSGKTAGEIYERYLAPDGLPILSSAARRPKRRRIVSTLRAASLPSPTPGGSRSLSANGKKLFCALRNTAWTV